MISDQLSEDSDRVMVDQIRRVVADYGRLPVDVATLSDEADLYRAGLTSHASVNLMLALEDTFDIEFPERLLRRRTFESVSAIRDAVEELVGRQAESS